MPKGIKSNKPHVYVRLEQGAFDALVQIAETEERPVSKQAAFFLKKGMEAYAEAIKAKTVA